MDPKSSDILNAALGLSDDDRAMIAERLLATLAPDEDRDDDAFLAELDRREREARHDPDATIAWSDLRNEP